MRTTKMIFFFNDTATTEIYTLSLHDALPIYASHSPTFLGYRILDYEGSGAWLTCHRHHVNCPPIDISPADTSATGRIPTFHPRSEEHTSELQSRQYLVCRLLLEKKKNTTLLT